MDTPHGDGTSEANKTDRPFPMDLELLYRYRFSERERNGLRSVWRVLVDDYFSRWVDKNDAVLDYGAGTCYFINNVRAARRVALDANPKVKLDCTEGVEFIAGDSPSAPKRADLRRGFR